MTIKAIINAVDTSKQLYIDSRMVEIVFLEEITETIKVRFLESGIITYVTKSSISDRQKRDNYFEIDDILILRYER